MRLGVSIGYWEAGPPAHARELVAEADRLALDSVWTAESYGSDALTPLAWYGANTTKVRLGTSIMQMQARTPAATAMAAMTMDHLSGGRFILGLGSSGPQVVEGWHGQLFGQPLARTREYVQVVRKILAREEAVRFDGEYYQMPVRGGTGLGKPLRSIVHPLRKDLPIVLAAQGPKNVALSAEICDGCITLFFAPKLDSMYRAALLEGFARPGARRTPESFEVFANVDIIVDADIERAADRLRPLYALYIGGMGAADVNFHRNMFIRMGYEAECQKITDLYLSGQKAEAIAAVPRKMLEEMALIGPAEKIREDLQRWKSSVATCLVVHPRSVSALHSIGAALG